MTALGTAALLGACGGTSQDNTGGGGSHAAGGTGGGGGSGGVSSTSGLPCDIAGIIGQNCISCHGATPTQGVPMSLATLDDFKKPAKTDPTKTNGEMSVVRMNDTTFPMPPTGNLSAADIKTFTDWVTAGMPAGSCASPGDGGTPPPPTPVNCDPGQQWTGGNEGSSHMDPGQACIACHQSSFEAPLFTIAGTVYPDPHLVDNCNGTNIGTSGAGPLVVQITDSTGQSFSINVNSAGNFHSSTPVTFPISAKVVDTSNNAERAMVQSVPSGDCNTCHTWDGANGAPGRITAP